MPILIKFPTKKILTANLLGLDKSINDQRRFLQAQIKVAEENELPTESLCFALRILDAVMSNVGNEAEKFYLDLKNKGE